MEVVLRLARRFLNQLAAVFETTSTYNGVLFERPRRQNVQISNAAYPRGQADGLMLMPHELHNWLLFSALRVPSSACNTDRAVFANRNFLVGFIFHKLFHSKNDCKR